MGLLSPNWVLHTVVNAMGLKKRLWAHSHASPRSCMCFWGSCSNYWPMPHLPQFFNWLAPEHLKTHKRGLDLCRVVSNPNRPSKHNQIFILLAIHCCTVELVSASAGLQGHALLLLWHYSQWSCSSLWPMQLWFTKPSKSRIQAAELMAS